MSWFQSVCDQSVCIITSLQNICRKKLSNCYAVRCCCCSFPCFSGKRERVYIHFLREEYRKLLFNKGNNIENYSNLQKLQHKSDGDTTTDTTTAALCKHLRKIGTLHWSDLTFTFNTDGSPLFKSSKSSVWPIQFVINELLPSLRFQHCMLSGLWFGPKHWLPFSKSL